MQTRAVISHEPRVNFCISQRRQQATVLIYIHNTQASPDKQKLVAGEWRSCERIAESLQTLSSFVLQVC